MIKKYGINAKQLAIATPRIGALEMFKAVFIMMADEPYVSPPNTGKIQSLKLLFTQELFRQLISMRITPEAIVATPIQFGTVRSSLRKRTAKKAL